MLIRFLILIFLICLFSCEETKQNASNHSSQTDSNASDFMDPDSISMPLGYSGYFFEDVSVQTFRIRDNKDTLLIGNEGTRVHIPGGALVHLDGSKVEGPVEFKMREYTRPGEMILAGLSTRQKEGGILRTGGMIHIAAYSEGKELRVGDTQPIQVDFPVQEEEIKGMRLFKGERNSGGVVNWELARKPGYSNRSMPDTADISVFDYMPRCLECFKTMKRILDRDYKAYFPQSELSYTLIADIEPGGKISYIEFPDSFPSALKEGVLNALDSIQPLFAARVYGKEKRYSASFKLKFNKVKNKVRVSISSPDVSEYSGLLLAEMIDQEIYTVYLKRKNKPLQKWNPQLTNYRSIPNMIQFGENHPLTKYGRFLEVYSDSLIFEVPDWEILNAKKKYYSQFSYSLGFLNCDVFDNYPPGATQDFYLKNLPENVVGIAYYPQRKVLLSGNPMDEYSLSFGSLPKSLRFNLICFGPVNADVPKEETDWYFSQVEVNETNWNNPSLKFKTLSYHSLCSQIRKYK